MPVLGYAFVKCLAELCNALRKGVFSPPHVHLPPALVSRVEVTSEMTVRLPAQLA